jgi:hypothetical protein
MIRKHCNTLEYISATDYLARWWVGRSADTIAAIRDGTAAYLPVQNGRA